MAVKCNHVGLVGREPVVNQHFPPAGFIEDGNFHAVSKRGGLVRRNDAHTINEAVRSDIVIGDIALHGADEAVVAHGDVVQAGVADPAMAGNAAAKRKRPGEGTQADAAAEGCPYDMGGAERIGHLYEVPILRYASLLLKGGDFRRGQLSVFHFIFILQLHFLPGSGAGPRSGPWPPRYDRPAAGAGSPKPAGKGNWAYGEPQ